MITAIKKRRNIIIFYLIITLIGLTSGYKFYSYQEAKTKQTIIEKIDIKENLSYKTNNILNDFKDILKILIYSTLLIALFINIFNIFYKSFQIGFLFNILNSLNTKLSIIYLSIYKVVPLIFLIILSNKGIKITKSIISYLLNKKKEHKQNIMLNIKRFISTSFILISYEFIIFLYSEIINKYLLTLLNIM
jgi:hypothetical protein